MNINLSAVSYDTAVHHCKNILQRVKTRE